MTAGTVGSAVVACGEVYRNSKIRSIPPDFLSSFPMPLPQSAVNSRVTAISGQLGPRRERHFLQLGRKKIATSGPDSGRSCRFRGDCRGTVGPFSPFRPSGPFAFQNGHPGLQGLPAARISREVIQKPMKGGHITQKSCADDIRTARPESLAVIPQIPQKSVTFQEKLEGKMAILGNTELQFRLRTSRVL